MSSSIDERTAGNGGRWSGAARVWLGGLGAGLVLGGAVAAGTILARAPDAAVLAPPARSEAADPAVAPAPPRLIDLEITHDAVRGAAWAAGRPTDQPAPPSAADGDAVVEGPFGYEVVGRDAASTPAVGPAVGGMVAVRRSNGDPAGTTFRPVAPEDGYHDEGLQGYEWRPRPAR